MSARSIDFELDPLGVIAAVCRERHLTECVMPKSLPVGRCVAHDVPVQFEFTGVDQEVSKPLSRGDYISILKPLAVLMVATLAVLPFV